VMLIIPLPVRYRLNTESKCGVAPSSTGAPEGAKSFPRGRAHQKSAYEHPLVGAPMPRQFKIGDRRRVARAGDRFLLVTTRCWQIADIWVDVDLCAVRLNQPSMPRKPTMPPKPMRQSNARQG
jgi:hypothetical protein